MTCSLFAHSLLGPLASPRPKAEEEKRKRRGEAIAVGQGSALEAVQKMQSSFLMVPRKQTQAAAAAAYLSRKSGERTMLVVVVMLAGSGRPENTHTQMANVVLMDALFGPFTLAKLMLERWSHRL